MVCIAVYCDTNPQQSGKGKKGAKVVKQVVEEKPLGPTNVKEGELVFGVVHIYASFNDTFIVCPLLFLPNPEARYRLVR
jgi:hypothetical protein